MKNLWILIAIATVAVVSLCFVSSSSQEPALAVESSVEVRRARIVAAGDLMQHDEQVKAALRSDSTYDYSSSFRFVAERFRKADLAIVNLETTLSDKGPYTGYPTFCSPAAVADAMRDMGVDVAALANNHCCDRTSAGIRSTISVLDRRGIAHVGTYHDSLDYKINNVQYIYGGDMRFAIVNYTYGTNGIPTPSGMVVNHLDTVEMARTLTEVASSKVDCTIAIVHWGNEYERNPNRQQRQMADFLHRHGVDIIIGSHPHVVQMVQADANQITIYSLGNFVSNQRTRYRDGGLIATIDIEVIDSLHLDQRISRRHNLSLELSPVWVHLPDYAILPREVGDTMSMSDDSRRRYNTFMNDTREHLGI